MTPAAVARWMLDEFERQDGYLAQEDAADTIGSKFGTAFVYDNENGNLAIDRKVLDAFRKLTAETVVWDRGERAWRRRDLNDPPGRQSDD